VLAGKGTLRRAKIGRALAGCAPFRRNVDTTGGSGGNTIQREIRFKEPDGRKADKERGVYTKLLTLPCRYEESDKNATLVRLYLLSEYSRLQRCEKIVRILPVLFAKLDDCLVWHHANDILGGRMFSLPR
jgi:hypothetical protein